MESIQTSGHINFPVDRFFKAHKFLSSCIVTFIKYVALGILNRQQFMVPKTEEHLNCFCLGWLAQVTNRIYVYSAITIYGVFQFLDTQLHLKYKMTFGK